jgi:hypothetical protein
MNAKAETSVLAVQQLSRVYGGVAVTAGLVT